MILSGRIRRASLAFLVALLASSVQAADAPLFEPVDSTVWQAHFETWVETYLVRDEIQQAAANLPLFDPEATLRILRELESAHVHAWRDELFLPRDLSGAAGPAGPEATPTSQSSLQPGTGEDHRQPRWAWQRGQGQRRPAGRGQDALGVRGGTHAGEARLVFRAMPARVVGDIDDDVSASLTPRQQLGHAGDRLRSAVDDTVKIDEKEHDPMVAAAPTSR